MQGEFLQQEQQEIEYDQQDDQGINNKQSLFDTTLNQITSRYIHSKYKLINNSNNLAKVDLRNMCDNVKGELEQIEKEAAYDYLKVEKEMFELDDEISKSDNILEQLEKVLLNFRDHLNEIKSEMTQLQERSLKMNTSLTNRKQLQKLLNTFMDSAVLDPKLIDAINEKPIDENYVEHIKILCQKLEYLKNTQLSDATAIKELEPELNKLKNKACGRVREFLLEKISILKKPMTNIQIMQKNVLIKYRIFTEFLKEHYLEIYVELCKNYAEVLSKIYVTKFKSYVKELEKQLVDIYTKHDPLFSENHSYYRIFLKQQLDKIKPIVHQENKSIFHLMQRDQVLNNIDEEPIVCQVAQQNNQKYAIEYVFKSINKLLMDSIANEVQFTSEFFNLQLEQNQAIFGDIFKQTYNYLFDYFKQLIQTNFDCVGMLLMILINEFNKKFYTSRIFDVANYYFDHINIIIWPRFEALFEIHKQSIDSLSMKQYKIIEKQQSWKSLITRCIDFHLSLYRLYSYFDNNGMLQIRIQSLGRSYLKLFNNASLDMVSEFDKVAYLLRIYDFVLTNFNQFQLHQVKKEYQDDILYLEKELSKQIDSLTNIYLNDLFYNFIDFVKKYAKAEAQEEGAVINFGVEEKKINEGQKDKPVDNIKLIENICTDLNYSWNKRIDSFKLECESKFPGTEALKKILKKFMTIFMAYYSSFFKYVKNNYPSYTSQMIKVHEMMREIQKIYNI